MPNSKIKILVVDDEPKIRLLLRRCLESDGYQVLEAANANKTFELIQSEKPDLITLDLRLGEDSGLSIAAKIRATSNVPIIMVTGKGEVIDKVVGLEMGADDYIPKPFHVREVLARVKTVLRRTNRLTKQKAGDQLTGNHSSIEREQKFRTMRFEQWTVKPDSFELLNSLGDMCHITTADFKLLMVFLENSKKVLSRDRIMDLTNGIEWTPNDRTIDNQVARLRKKIEEDPANPSLIKTVRGIGYMFTRDVVNSDD
jgi:DNA-binding response OmpR family regulator